MSGNTFYTVSDKGDKAILEPQPVNPILAWFCVAFILLLCGLATYMTVESAYLFFQYSMLSFALILAFSITLTAGLGYFLLVALINKYSIVVTPTKMYTENKPLPMFTKSFLKADIVKLRICKNETLVPIFVDGAITSYIPTKTFQLVSVRRIGKDRVLFSAEKEASLVEIAKVIERQWRISLDTHPTSPMKTKLKSYI